MPYTHQDLTKAYLEWANCPLSNDPDMNQIRGRNQAWEKYVAIRDSIEQEYRKYHRRIVHLPRKDLIPCG